MQAVIPTRSERAKAIKTSFLPIFPPRLSSLAFSETGSHDLHSPYIYSRRKEFEIARALKTPADLLMDDTKAKIPNGTYFVSLEQDMGWDLHLALPSTHGSARS